MKTSAFLTFRLELLSRTAMAKASKVYKQEVGLNIRELRVVRVIGEEPGISSKELSDQTFIEQTLVSKHLRKLTAEGYVERALEASDARRVALTLTEKGRRARDRARVLGEAMEREFWSVLTTEERSLFEQCITKLSHWAAED